MNVVRTMVARSEMMVATVVGSVFFQVQALAQFPCFPTCSLVSEHDVDEDGCGDEDKSGGWVWLLVTNNESVKEDSMG